MTNKPDGLGHLCIIVSYDCMCIICIWLVTLINYFELELELELEFVRDSRDKVNRQPGVLQKHFKK